MTYRTPREYGYLIGEAFSKGDLKRARATFEEAQNAVVSQSTRRDYSEPVAELITCERVIGVFSSLGITKVSDYYRISPNVIEARAKLTFSGAGRVAKQSQIIEAKYSPRLHGRLPLGIVNRLIDADVLTCWDVANTAATELARIVSYHLEDLRAINLLQRELR